MVTFVDSWDIRLELKFKRMKGVHLSRLPYLDEHVERETRRVSSWEYHRDVAAQYPV